MLRRLKSPRSSSGPAVGLTLGLAVGLSLALGGCASGGLLGQLPPAIGGEPADLPPAPPTPYNYPAVHDLPPPRATKPLNDNDQIRLEKELESARDSQQNKYGSAPKPDKKPAAAAKKKSAGGKGGQAAGGSGQGAKSNGAQGE